MEYSKHDNKSKLDDIFLYEYHILKGYLCSSDKNLEYHANKITRQNMQKTIEYNSYVIAFFEEFIKNDDILYVDSDTIYSKSAYLKLKYIIPYTTSFYEYMTFYDKHNNMAYVDGNFSLNNHSLVYPNKYIQHFQAEVNQKIRNIKLELLLEQI